MKTEGTLTIHTQKRGAALGDLFGIFFEDLNHAADGGLYAELVQNRSFEFDPIDRADYHSLMAWEHIERGDGKTVITVEDSEPLNDRNPHYVAIDIVAEGDGVGLMNLGFNSGIPVKRARIISSRYMLVGRQALTYPLSYPLKVQMVSFMVKRKSL